MNKSYEILTNWKQDQRFTGILLQDGGENSIKYHMWGEYSNSQLHANTGGEGKKVGSSPQVKFPNSCGCYKCGKQDHFSVNFLLGSLDAQVHTQSTSKYGDATVTPCETSQIDKNNGSQLKQVALSAAHQATQIIIDSTHSSGNGSSSIITADSLRFETGLKMCQDKCLLVNPGRSGKAFNITIVGVTHTWILLDSH